MARRNRRKWYPRCEHCGERHAAAFCATAVRVIEATEPTTRPKRYPLCEHCGELLGAIDRSGLSKDEFARTVLVRHKSTLYRWLRGEVEIPAVVLEKLEALNS